MFTSNTLYLLLAKDGNRRTSSDRWNHTKLDLYYLEDGKIRNYILRLKSSNSFHLAISCGKES